MINLITGLIGVVLFVVFLSHYAIILHSPPLWIILVGITTLMIADYVLSLKNGNNNGNNSGNNAG
jgi:hypothetical protein